MFRAFSQGSSCCDAGTLNLAVFECWQSWPTTMRTINYSEVTDRASLVAQIVKNLPAAQETQLNPCIGAILQRREWQPTLVFSPGEFHWQRNLVGYSPWCRKESDTTELWRFHFFFTPWSGHTVQQADTIYIHTQNSSSMFLFKTQQHKLLSVKGVYFACYKYKILLISI